MTGVIAWLGKHSGSMLVKRPISSSYLRTPSERRGAGKPAPYSWKLMLWSASVIRWLESSHDLENNAGLCWWNALFHRHICEHRGLHNCFPCLFPSRWIWCGLDLSVNFFSMPNFYYFNRKNIILYWINNSIIANFYTVNIVKYS